MYEIRPPPPSGDKPWAYPNLFEPPFRLLIVSPSGSGKTVLLANLIGSPDFPYLEEFSQGRNVFLFSSTFSLGDQSMAMAKIKPENIFNSLDISILDAIVADQRSIIEQYGKKKAPSVLCIFDDIAHQLSYRAKEALKGYFFSLRHYKISMILIIQSYKSIPRAVRINSTDIILFYIGNDSERQVIASEMPCQQDYFLSILDDATTEKYSFLVIHNKRPMEKRFQKRFTDEYYTFKN
jgi:hypothetical protein